MRLICFKLVPAYLTGSLLMVPGETRKIGVWLWMEEAKRKLSREAEMTQTSNH